ncbi:hypothetical protein PL81_31065 [Streptomyces sp. RSD-27]|nr:hypothetical protein PL81_31065 [Streptomyces sp. RSD-27]
MTSDYYPLVEASLRSVSGPDPLDDCRRWAAGVLAEQQAANIQDYYALRHAAFMLERALRELLASVDAEVGAL